MRARAALWVTELHSPERSAKLEAKVQRWLDRDPRHAAAFRLATEAWQGSGNLPAELRSRPAYRLKGRQLLVKRLASACAAIAIAAVTATFYLARDGTLVTGPGERKTVALSDGTEVSLNANSRLIVEYDERVRKVTLTRGEALFTVTKHQARPFVVVIGERKVIATGTAFLVRKEEPTEAAAGDAAFANPAYADAAYADAAYAVTLVEGRVAVEPVSWPDTLPGDRAPQALMLRPGERIRFHGAEASMVDLPSIEKITAWQHGQLIFDDSSLREAAAEFNRYGRHRLRIDSPSVGNLRVGGVYKIGDSASFAQAMANTYHLRIVHRGHDIVLTDKPAE